MRNYPGMILQNKNYKPEGSNTQFELYWSYVKQIYYQKLKAENQSIFPFTILNGPYKDMKDGFINKKSIVTFNSILILKGQLYGRNLNFEIKIFFRTDKK